MALAQLIDFVNDQLHFFVKLSNLILSASLDLWQQLVLHLH